MFFRHEKALTGDSKMYPTFIYNVGRLKGIKQLSFSISQQAGGVVLKYRGNF